MRAVVNKKIDTLWFVKLLKDNGYTIRGYAKAIKESDSNISRMFRGLRHMYTEDVENLHRVTGASKAEILTHLGMDIEADEHKKLKLAGTINAARTIHLTKAKNAPSVVPPPDAIDTTLAFRYQTSGSHLDALDGAVIYCRPLDVLTIDMMNRWCVVRIKGGDEVVRIIKRGSKAGKFTLGVEGKEIEQDVLIDAASLIEWVKF